jgi:membrane-associated protein
MMINQDTLVEWVNAIGYVGISLIIFAETGFFFGFFLPGDSLLFLAGLLASRELLSMWILVPVLILASFLGYLFAYWFGKRLGGWLVHRPDSFWYKKIYIDKAHAFYKRFGPVAVLLGRMVPVVRTFCGIVAGMVHMDFKPFLVYNLLGSILWACIFTILGYYVGDVFPNIVDYLMILVLCIIIGSILLPIVHERIKKKKVKKLD